MFHSAFTPIRPSPTETSVHHSLANMSVSFQEVHTFHSVEPRTMVSFQFPLNLADFNNSPHRSTQGGTTLTRPRRNKHPRAIAVKCRNASEEEGCEGTETDTEERYPIAAAIARKKLPLTSLVLAIPLACSFLLTVVGIVAVIFVNRHYSEEAAATFPITIATSVSLYIRREVEAEMNVPLLAVHKPLAAMYATGLMPIPIYNATSPTTRILPVGSNDTSLLQVRDEENARRAKWHRQNSANSIRMLQSTPNMIDLGTLFSSDAQSRGEYTTDSEEHRILRGVTHYGDDVEDRKSYMNDRMHIVEGYDPSRGRHVANNDSTFFYYAFEEYQYSSERLFFSEWIQKWKANRTASTGHQQGGLLKALKPRLQAAMTLVNGSYALARYITGPIIDSIDGSLVGILDMRFGFESVGKSIEALAKTSLSNDAMSSSNVQVTSFILSESGTVLAATGATNDDLVIHSAYVTNDPKEQNPEKRCVSTTTLGSVEDQYSVDSTCDRYPHEFASNPVIQATAPHLASVCGDDNPLLGTATSVTLPVDGSERPFAIICEKLSSPGDSYFYESYGKNFSSWRIVTLVSERELVDPLVRVMPGTLLAAGIGIGICALACIVAGVVAYILNRRGAFKAVDDGVAEHIENDIPK